MTPRSGSKASVETIRTDRISASDLVAIRSLLDRAFDGEFTDDDWGHSLGGHHVLVRHPGRLVAHASVVPRAMLVDDREVGAGYVEAVATAPDDQGLGLGSTAMRAAADLIGERFEIGVLSTGASPFYERLGWRRWQGTTWVIGADGVPTRTPDEDDGVMVLGDDVDVSGSIACRSRPGDDW